jgi:predicted glycogen debranching enzyme
MTLDNAYYQSRTGRKNATSFYQMFAFGRDVCNYLPTAEKREWLITNGIGGYACGTISGLLTRRYHGLLVAALKPPLGRTLLLTKLDETATYGEQTYLLFANRWAADTVEPAGFHHLEYFHLDGTSPVWTFSWADALLEKRVWLKPEANTTYIRYTLLRATSPLTLTAKALVNFRDYHASTRANAWQMKIVAVPDGLQVVPYDGATPFYLLSAQATVEAQHSWYRDYYLSAEAYRGLDAVDDHLHAGVFSATLSRGDSLTLVTSTEPDPDLDGKRAFEARKLYEQRLIARGAKFLTPGPSTDQEPDLADRVRHLLLAADQFVVRRPLPDGTDGCSIIAGYPWFGDWGRDTMIALPGLTLYTGRLEVARTILKTYAQYVDQGMLPNRFPESDSEPDYNTADAVLWYFRALHHYVVRSGDYNLVRELYPILVDILEWHQRGTRYNIHVDPQDGLLYAGEPGLQLTWMDAKIGDWVITPRIGKPVEINALWYNVLRVMARFSKQLQKSTATVKKYNEQADFVADNFRRRFWHEAGGYLCDVIDGPGGDRGHDGKRYDRRLRPNQIFAVSLPFKLLNDEQAKSVVDVCARYLLTPYGLRSLSANEPAYVGGYGGDPYQRDGAYHQGTVWGWLIGPFVRAHLQVYQNPTLARSFLLPLLRHLASDCAGNISEIFDGDPPFSARGSIAQAWSVAELLHAWQETTT